MRNLIVGLGEVGSGLHQVVKGHHETFTKDIGPEYTLNGESSTKCPEDIDLIHICLNHIPGWEDIASSYIAKFRPMAVNVQTTMPPGSTERLQARTGVPCVHSTTRGLHPNLAESMQTFVKHIGGHEDAQVIVGQFFKRCGLAVEYHARARTTELAHIVSNATYGINLMFADEVSKLCRHYGVDYIDMMRYAQTCNDGYRELGHESKMRMVIYPPHGKIGGHCLNYAGQQIPEELRGDLMGKLATYGVIDD